MLIARDADTGPLNPVSYASYQQPKIAPAFTSEIKSTFGSYHYSLSPSVIFPCWAVFTGNRAWFISILFWVAVNTVPLPAMRRMEPSWGGVRQGFSMQAPGFGQGIIQEPALIGDHIGRRQGLKVSKWKGDSDVSRF